MPLDPDGSLMQKFCAARCPSWCQPGESPTISHPFFIHQLSLEGRDITPFISLAMQCQYLYEKRQKNRDVTVIFALTVVSMYLLVLFDSMHTLIPSVISSRRTPPLAISSFLCCRGSTPRQTDFRMNCFVFYPFDSVM